MHLSMKFTTFIISSFIYFNCVFASSESELPPAPSPSPSKICTHHYKAKQGDKCHEIWKHNGITKHEFFELNPDVNCRKKIAGQMLCLSNSFPDKSTCGKIYTPAHGETCASVSRAANLNIEAFTFINPTIDCSRKLVTGREICISPCHKYTAKSSTPKKKQLPVLMDYLGAMGSPILLTEIPIRNDVEQYFILSFAIDENHSGEVQNGNFSSYWIDSLTPHAVTHIKSEHPHVKVMLSLSGYSLLIRKTNKTQVLKWYEPKDADLWIENAVSSITSLVKTYHLDGIDIDYESLDAKKDKLFTFCIGQLIKTLKHKNVITTATIAPYGDTVESYSSLVHHYGEFIDYVNFQFYSYHHLKSSTDLVQKYEKIAESFDKKKMLVSLEVNGRGVKGNEFFQGLEELRRKHGIPGMFLWCAEESKKNSFLVEKVAQCSM